MEILPTRIAVFGYPTWSDVYAVEQLPTDRGAILPGTHVASRLGGGPAHTATMLTSHGHEAVMVSEVGSGEPAIRCIEELEARGVDTAGLAFAHREVPRYLVLLTPDGERTVIGWQESPPGPPADLDPAGLEGCDAVYMPIATRAYAEAIPSVRRRAPGLPVVGTWPDPGVTRWPVDVVIASVEEIDDEEEADPLAALAGRCGSTLAWVVLTAGAAGATAHGRDGTVLHVPAVELAPREVVDTTGAGDAFAAGFCAGWVATGDIERALDFGVRWGAEAVQRLGTLAGDE